MGDQGAKHVGDLVAAGGSVVAVLHWFFHALMTWLPAAVATMSGLASFTWFCIRIYESSTVQRWINRKRKK